MFSLATVAGPEVAGVARIFQRFVLQRAEELAPRATGRKLIGRGGSPEGRSGF
jgi:LysR family transcriptional regulator, transcriptional activator of the cysJI operon